MVGITGQGKALIPKAGSKLLANVKAQTPNKMGMAKQSSQARKQQAEAPASTYRGIVTWFDSGKKFGFLRARPGRGGNDGDAEDIFVHLRQVQVAGWQDLQKGDTVFFEVENRRGQKCAINLRKQYDRPAANLKLAATEAKSATSVPVRGKQAQKPVETQSAKNSKNTLGALLRAAGCPQHLAVMQENEFDVESLGLSELEDLVEIGIPRRDGERILAAAVVTMSVIAVVTMGHGQDEPRTDPVHIPVVNAAEIHELISADAEESAEQQRTTDALRAEARLRQVILAAGCTRNADAIYSLMHDNALDTEALSLTEARVLEALGVPRKFSARIVKEALSETMARPAASRPARQQDQRSAQAATGTDASTGSAGVSDTAPPVPRKLTREVLHVVSTICKSIGAPSSAPHMFVRWHCSRLRLLYVHVPPTRLYHRAL